MHDVLGMGCLMSWATLLVQQRCIPRLAPCCMTRQSSPVGKLVPSPCKLGHYLSLTVHSPCVRSEAVLCVSMRPHARLWIQGPYHSHFNKISLDLQRLESLLAPLMMMTRRMKGAMRGQLKGMLHPHRVLSACPASASCNLLAEAHKLLQLCTQKPCGSPPALS